MATRRKLTPEQKELKHSQERNTMNYHDDYDQDEWDERVDTFANPGGNSALRRASRSNPRNLPCPTCGTENVLTPADVARGYQCDRCADAAEMGF